MLTITKADAIAFLVALSFSKAPGWKTSKLAEKLSLVPDNVKPADVPDGWEKFYKELVEAEGKVKIEGEEADATNGEDDAKTTPENGEKKESKVKNKTKANSKNKKPRGESKCGYIDSLLEKGGYTMREIAEMAHKKFGGDIKATLSTVRVRPSHMRDAGRKPKWEEEKKAPAAKKTSKKK